MVAGSHEEEEILLLPLEWLRGERGEGDREFFILLQDCYVEMLHFIKKCVIITNVHHRS